MLNSVSASKKLWDPIVLLKQLLNFCNFQQATVKVDLFFFFWSRHCLIQSSDLKITNILTLHFNAYKVIKWDDFIKEWNK